MSDVNLMAEASTFGPLEVIERDFGGVEAFLVPAGGDLSDDIGSLLIDRDDHTPEQMRAWARLFAAAPDLLAALKEMGDWIAGGLQASDEAWPEARCLQYTQDLARRARAAVDKAEGRS